ncbi:MAG: peptidylprolyl isomerase [Acidobacteria bacterium]|nr:peptidylprolyl isomerase [Acidobacteriota bacterium]
MNEAGRAWRRRRLLLACLCLVLSVLAVSCGGDARTSSKDYDADDDAAAAAPNVTKGVKPEPDAEAAVLETSYGPIVIELYPNLAPKMVERFKSLAKEGFYNGTTFHRVDPSAGVVQGGDPNSKDDNPQNDGAGDSPSPDVPAEFSDIPFDRAIVGAARQGPRPAFGGQPGLTEAEAFNSANCQFYITLRRVPIWDGQYTVFGKVIEGMGNADIIAGAPTMPGTKNPEEKIVIKSITFKPRSDFK